MEKSSFFLKNLFETIFYIFYIHKNSQYMVNKNEWLKKYHKV